MAKKTIIIICNGNQAVIKKLLEITDPDFDIVVVSKDHIYPMCLVDVKDIEKSILPGKLELIDKLSYHDFKSGKELRREKRKFKNKK